MHVNVPKDTTWSCTQEVEDAKSGKTFRVPAGTSCEQCFSIALDHLHYPRFSDFAEEYESSEQVQNIVAQIRKNLAQPGSAVDFETATVSKTISTVVRVDTQFDAKTNAELRKALGVQRLSREQVNKLPTVELPEDGGGRGRTLFVCA